ncbi:hypothetical protein SASPL_119347 [Salvia splendens]|uniref:Uncharacterized protein n=1 Tax=Salvia splendens TaxID=180675 RepID=A0A8X8XMM8_SALSN|nr:hypothetical protein SASPL_119347 [Salvia splendens]
MTPKASSDPITARHVVAVSYPGRGHVNPMMNLCKLLVASDPDLLITVVLTEEWLGLIGAEEKPPSIRFAAIPNVLPSELDRAADMPSFVSATQNKMAEPFERLMDRLGHPIHFLIADTFLFWAVDFGNRRNIPVASLWPMPASVFSVFYHFDLLRRNGHHPFRLPEKGEERIDYVPGIDSIRLVDLPSIVSMKDERLLGLALRVFSNISKAQYLLFSSIYELESQAIEALKHEFSFPIYTFGPTIPYLNLETLTFFSANESDDHHNYLKWLNSQTPGSVLYVSLGSFLSVSHAQMDEIADGLLASGVRFLWVARGEAKRLQERCGRPGEPCLGVSNSRCCAILLLGGSGRTVDGIRLWNIGVDGKKDLAFGEILTSGEVAKIVKEFMDPFSHERREMAKRAREFGDTVRQAISKGGSSVTNLACLLSNIKSFS